jgi:tRNA modification GTPase
MSEFSLLNVFLQEERAIVTPIRERPRHHRRCSESDGIPIRLIDTAGLRENFDQVERLGSGAKPSNDSARRYGALRL